jgi:very-short-patch-repair endonuclease
MRHEPTQSEWVLWHALRCRQLGVSFRRQVVLQGYITNFYARSARLIVEVDGGWHGKRVQRDARRERILRAAGY